MPPYDFLIRRFFFPECIPRPPPCTYEYDSNITQKGGVTAMYDDEYMDYLMEYYELLTGTNPFDNWTEEEWEEFMRQLNDDFEDDYQWSGRL